MPKPLALHWARSKPNFGDVLAPLICAELSRRPIQWAPVERCDLVALGSLLQRVKEGFWRKRVHVWGAGFIEPVRRHPSRHFFHAIRGRYSAELVSNIADDVVFGDPGLLADLLLDQGVIPEKRCRCAIIPHYKDKGHPAIAEVIKAVADVEIIDVFAPPMETLERIRAAEFVLSSAMHGLIAADSLGVPNAWIRLSGGVRGGDFKFRDYYSVFGIEAKALTLTPELLRNPGVVFENYERPGLQRIRERLMSAFPHDI
ncbi:MAG TPA: polysaccharide pyruvyl transferase family protein [Azoarcus taiwanensis]|nr:polysaccharide pyruvyl transferase family protein [Azoarcus taiwanensis]